MGDRLVMAVDRSAAQRLLRVVKKGQDDYEERDLGPIRFVPLVTAE